MRRTLTAAALLLCAALAFTGCENDSSDAPKQRYDLTQGMVITNEGSFQGNIASISLYYAQGDSIANDVFYKVNSRVLGDVLQSMAFSDDKAYFVVNGSNKIEVADKKSCKEIATIDKLEGPRYMAIDGNKGYVTCWGNKSVTVIDLTTNTVKKKIEVGNGPEALIVVGNLLYVANSGGYGRDNTISVINLKTETVEKTITVADIPRSIALDKNGNLWVACSGFVSNWNDLNDAANTKSAICKIEPAKDFKVTTMEISKTYRPTQICTNGNGNTVYYGAGYAVKGIFAMSVESATLPTEPLIDQVFYGFSVNPTTNEIFGLIAFTKENNNTLARYSATGKLLNDPQKDYRLGIGPNGAYFVR